MRSLLFLLALVACSSATTEQKEVVRHVKGQELISKRDPEIAVKFSTDFIFAGSESFILFGVSEVEQFHFVKCDSSRRIRAMYTIQFEKYLPNVSSTFDYDIPDKVKINEVEWMHSPVYNNPERVFERARQSDVWHKFRFLQSKGYALPAEVTGHRFIRLLDDSRKREILIIYNEEIAGDSTAQVAVAFQHALDGFIITAFR